MQISLSRRLTAVFCGGLLGAITRYLLSVLIQGYLGKSWPYDILFINLSGALVLAVITTLADGTFLIGPTRRLFINVGFLGAYTTFSSLALGDVQLLANGRIIPALVYLLASLFGGILAVLLGDWLGHWLINILYRRGPQTLTTTVPDAAIDRHLDVQDDVLTQ